MTENNKEKFLYATEDNELNIKWNMQLIKKSDTEYLLAFMQKDGLAVTPLALNDAEEFNNALAEFIGKVNKITERNGSDLNV